MLNYHLHHKTDVKDNAGLHNYGFAAYPGSYQAQQAYLDKTTGKYRTGLDEYAPEILTIKDAAARKAKQEEIKEKRAQLEAKFGEPGILDAKNASFWDNFWVPIEVGLDGKAKIDGALEFSPSENPRHELMLIVAKANNMIAFGKEEAYSPSYRDAVFYLTTEDEEDKINKSNAKAERARQVEMSKLFDGDTKDVTKAWEIAYFLGLKPKKNVSDVSLEISLDTATKIDPKKRDEFIVACNMDKEDLLISNTFKKAVALNIVKIHPTDKVYYRGGVNYRAKESESIAYLKMPEMLTELTSLMEEVRKAESKRKNIA